MQAGRRHEDEREKRKEERRGAKGIQRSSYSCGSIPLLHFPVFMCRPVHYVRSPHYHNGTTVTAAIDNRLLHIITQSNAVLKYMLIIMLAATATSSKKILLL